MTYMSPYLKASILQRFRPFLSCYKLQLVGSPYNYRIRLRFDRVDFNESKQLLIKSYFVLEMSEFSWNSLCKNLLKSSTSTKGTLPDADLVLTALLFKPARYVEGKYAELEYPIKSRVHTKLYLLLTEISELNTSTPIPDDFPDDILEKKEYLRLRRLKDANRTDPP